MVSIYIYAFRFLENGYMNPTSIGATWVSNKNDGPPHHPPTVWPRSSDKPKVDLRSKSPRFNHGNHFFLQNNSFFSQRIPRLCVVFWANHSLTHQILPERKPKTFHKLRPDVEKDLIFKNPRDFWPPNKQKPWLKTFCLSKSPISYGLWAWFLYLWLRKSCR